MQAGAHAIPPEAPENSCYFATSAMADATHAIEMGKIILK
jgi:hypothetical protein